MNYDAAVIVFSLLSVLRLDIYIRVFFDKRRTSLPVYAASFLYYLVLINVASILRIPNGAPVVLITTYFVLSLNYEGSWKKRILAAFSLFAIGFTVDLGVFLAFGFTRTAFAEHSMHTTMSMAVSGLAILAAGLLLHKLKNLRKGVAVPSAQWVSFLALALSSIFVASALSIYADMPTFAAIITSVFLFGVNVLFFYLHDGLSAAHEAKLKAALHSQEREYYAAQCRLMRESSERAMSIRHDMKAHLATLKGFVLADGSKPYSAVEYIDRLLGDIGDSKPLSDTGNPAFDSVVNYKLRDAAKLGVRLDANLQVPPALAIDDADIVTIVGNLLDNALEAAAKSAEKFIRLSAVLDNGALLIKAENSFSGEVRYAGGKSGREIASLKGGPEHGHGLRNVRRSAEKYGGHVGIAHEGGVFSVKILLKL